MTSLTSLASLPSLASLALLASLATLATLASVASFISLDFFRRPPAWSLLSRETPNTLFTRRRLDSVCLVGSVAGDKRSIASAFITSPPYVAVVFSPKRWLRFIRTREEPRTDGGLALAPTCCVSASTSPISTSSEPRCTFLDELSRREDILRSEFISEQRDEAPCRRRVDTLASASDISSNRDGRLNPVEGLRLGADGG